jgi:hypothetical protein
VRVEESVWRESGCGEEVCVERDVRGGVPDYMVGVEEVIPYYMVGVEEVIPYYMVGVEEVIPYYMVGVP